MGRLQSELISRWNTFLSKWCGWLEEHSHHLWELLFGTWQEGGDATDGVDENAGKIANLCEEIASLKTKRRLAETVKDGLHTQHSQLIAILEAMEDAVFIIDSNFKIQFANSAAINTFGSVDERPCYDYFYDRQERCPWCRKNLHPKDGSVRRTWKSPKTGKTFDVFEAPLENPDGTVSKLHILHDITEHIELQDSFSQNEQKYRTLVETMNEGLAGYDDNGLYTFVNDRFCEMVGYTRQELIGHPITDLLDEANREILHKQVAWRRKGERSSYELEHITKEGARITTLIRSSPIFDSRGRFRGGIATITDITQRKIAENLLRESERKYRELVENANSIIMRSDLEGNILFFNEFAQHFFGYKEEEIVGRNAIGTIFPRKDPQGRDLTDLFRDIVLHPERYIPYEGYGFQRSGEMVWISWTKKVISNEKGEPVGILCIGNDITARKRAEEQLHDSEKRLRHLSSQLLKAHEEERRRIAVELHDSIASSLAAIKFDMENLFERLKEGSDLLEPMDSLVSMMQQAIEETRAIMLDLRPSVLDDLGLLPAINWLLRKFQRTYTHIKVESKIKIKEDEIPEPLKIVIFRILQEALYNVAKHSLAELVNVSLVKKNSLLELVVQDSGVGFDFLEGGQNGMGIGLSSMQERAELSGGIFSIKSAKGEGTRVYAMWQIESSRG